MLAMTAAVLEGRMPDLRVAVVVRTAISERFDLFEPLNLKKQMKGAMLEVCACAARAGLLSLKKFHMHAGSEQNMRHAYV